MQFVPIMGVKMARPIPANIDGEQRPHRRRTFTLRAACFSSRRFWAMHSSICGTFFCAALLCAFALLVARWHVDITKLFYLRLWGRGWRLCDQTVEAEDWRISRRYIGG